MPDVGLEQIEANMLSRLQANWPATAAPIVEFDISADPKSIVCPGIYVAAECTGFKRVAHGEYKKLIAVHVVLIVSNLQGPSFRRKAVHPLVLAAEQLLIEQQLGLAISPLVPMRSPEITDAELRAALKIGFRIDLSTSCDITAVTEEEAVDLLKIVASYYKKPVGVEEVDVAAWTPQQRYESGAVVRPTAPNGHVYILRTSMGQPFGMSGATEPAWPTASGAGVVDGSCIWRENGLPPSDFIDNIDLS